MESRLQKTPIAIIGISSIFPDAKNLSEYWTNIINEVDCIKDVPPSRWKIEDYYDPDPKTPDKTYSKRGGFIPDIDFNPMEFGLPPNLLELTEVSQLLALVLAKQVLKDGGYADASDSMRQMTGVILGVGGAQKLMNPLVSRLQYPVWERVLKSVGISQEGIENIVGKIKDAYVKWEENSFPGTLGNITAGRIANRFDLGGTNCVVDAACASSFGGIRMAVHELLDYRSDMMITGGVDMDNSIYAYLCFSKTPAFSKKEKSQPFDKNSAGMIIGEGIGMLLLKRLEDAERDQDRIYAIIKGIGTSSDGKSKSIYGPNPEGQLIALNRAYQDAGINPDSVGLIEAHGTGTIAGDIAETTALKQLFEASNLKKNQISLGSVKSQIGHTKNAAGVAGLIKAAMALYHKILPATINIEEPNPKLSLDDSPFYLNTKTRPWITESESSPRRAGISAFGFGGTNFHLVLEEHQKEHESMYRRQQLAQPVFIVAPTPASLRTVASKQIELLRSKNSEFYFDQLKQASKSIDLPITSARLGIIAQNAEEAIKKLELALKQLTENPQQSEWNLPEGVFFRRTGLDLEKKVVALFAGQGSPYLNMGSELSCNYPILRSCFQKTDDLVSCHGLNSISQTVYPTPSFDPSVLKQQADSLHLTEYAQPAIGAFSAGQFKIFQSAGLIPTYTAGHSFGELTALWSAGVVSDEDYFYLAYSRGQAMAAPDEPGFDAGTMTAVIGRIESLKEDIREFKDVVVANWNSRKQVVLAGPKDQMSQAGDHLKEKGYTLVPLPVSAAFHTPLMQHAQKPFSEALDKVKFKRPKLSVYSNATGKPYPTQAKSVKKCLSEHILKTVHFKTEIENIYNDGGYVFIEFGPQNILTKLTDNILGDKPHIALAINPNSKKDSDRQLREAFVRLKVCGLQLTDIDPFDFPLHLEKKPESVLTLRLSGSNYVSDKTKADFENGLADGYDIRDHFPAIQESDTSESSARQIKSTIQPVPAVSAQITKPKPIQNREQQTGQATLSNQEIESSLSNFYTHQNEILGVHEQFLKSQAEYSGNFMRIMLQQAQNGNSITQELAQSISQFHNHQAETLRVHEVYLKDQTAHSKNSFELIKQLSTAYQSQPGIPSSESVIALPSTAPKQPTIESGIPVEPEPVAIAKVSPTQEQYTFGQEAEKRTPVNASVAEIVLQIVSDKTGYLADMLELEMDIEADLGIDSIKRVEILNSVQEKIPGFKLSEGKSLQELRTLNEIVEVFSANPTEEQDPNQQNVTRSTTNVNNDISDVLLNVISEKTGYLKEMLELGMDLETDLGIDSIKRVEILDDFQEKLPELSHFNTEALAELKTLEQIVDFISQPPEKATEPESQNISQTDDHPNLAPKNDMQDDVSKTLITIVSEKTGYLEEMLELDMDMEADLGIDSIKRVEILNGLQERMLALPTFNPSELSEIKTLRQIIDYIIHSQSGQQSSSQTGALGPKGTDLPPNDAQLITDVLLSIVSEKTGYPREMLDVNMDMEADLGIDSIKRVEILNGIQEAIPNLPPIDPDELSELVTLAQIIGQVSIVSGKKKLLI